MHRSVSQKRGSTGSPRTEYLYAITKRHQPFGVLRISARIARKRNTRPAAINSSPARNNGFGYRHRRDGPQNESRARPPHRCIHKRSPAAGTRCRDRACASGLRSGVSSPARNRRAPRARPRRRIFFWASIIRRDAVSSGRSQGRAPHPQPGAYGGAGACGQYRKRNLHPVVGKDVRKRIRLGRLCDLQQYVNGD